MRNARPRLMPHPWAVSGWENRARWRSSPECPRSPSGPRSHLALGRPRPTTLAAPRSRHHGLPPLLPAREVTILEGKKRKVGARPQTDFPGSVRHPLGVPGPMAPARRSRASTAPARLRRPTPDGPRVSGRERFSRPGTGGLRLYPAICQPVADFCLKDVQARTVEGGHAGCLQPLRRSTPLVPPPLSYG